MASGWDRRAREDEPQRWRRGRRVGATLGVAVAAILGAFAAQRPATPPPHDALAEQRLRAHLAFLADDLLAGRFTGSPGYEIAARYVASQLRQLGLRPASGTSYLLPVPLVATEVEVPSAVLEIVVAGVRRPLAWGDGFIASGNPLREETAVEAPAVFVGYGVSAPELGWDDYAGLEVRGKVVLAVRGGPARFPHDQRAYYASSENKRVTAAAHGAIALLVFRTAAEAAKSPWERIVRNYGRLPSMTWLEPDGTPHGALAPLLAVGILSDSGVATVLAASGRDLAATAPALDSGGKGFPLGVSLHLAFRAHSRRLQSSNVAAVLPGADPTLAREVVVVSAHLDHLGQREGGSGDTIYNGFYDNAMGSALLLETARACALARERPRRTMVFLAVTGEERGLLGSQHFASHPPPGLERVVADVNLDMPLFLHPVEDLVAFGAEHSTLEAAAQRAAHAAGFALAADPMPDEVIFVRSDQFSFVERGIPSVYLTPGFGSRDPKVSGEAASRGFLAEHYHQPSDDASLPVDWPSALRFLQANVVLARDIADAEAAPTWNPGDFFGRIFGGEQPTAAPVPPGRRLER